MLFSFEKLFLMDKLCIFYQCSTFWAIRNSSDRLNLSFIAEFLLVKTKLLSVFNCMEIPTTVSACNKVEIRRVIH